MNIYEYFVFFDMSIFLILKYFAFGFFSSQADAEIKLNLIFYDRKTKSHKFLFGPMGLRCSY